MSILVQSKTFPSIKSSLLIEYPCNSYLSVSEVFVDKRLEIDQMVQAARESDQNGDEEESQDWDSDISDVEDEPTVSGVPSLWIDLQRGPDRLARDRSLF
mmetsp:Transcript_58249/g.66488  ORF Transcript_58249/g.66488 Transcript_58249/m.66488 type:complete len:100 (+) Transcript_58249:30-329(+)